MILITIRQFEETMAYVAGFVMAVLGAIAQLGERLICIQEVRGSIPRSSTNASIMYEVRIISIQGSTLSRDCLVL